MAYFWVGNKIVNMVPDPQGTNTYMHGYLFLGQTDANGDMTIIRQVSGTDKNGVTWGYNSISKKYEVGGSAITNALDGTSRYYGIFIVRISDSEMYLASWNNTDIHQMYINDMRGTDVFPEGSDYGWAVVNFRSDLARTLQTSDIRGGRYISTSRISGSLYAAIIANGIQTDTIDPNDMAGTSTEGGGKGSHERLPKIINKHHPTLSAIDSGFVTAFVPTKTQIKNLADYMWSNLFDLNTLKKLFADPMDVILGLHILPVGVATSGSKEIKPGGVPTGVTANYTDTQYVEKDFGTIALEEFWGSYLDYSPYTKVNLFLPYIGMRTLNTDEVMGHTIGVSYNIDILSGALVAQVTVDGSVRYEFSGNCAMQIPVNGNDYRGAISSAITAAVTIGAGIASAGTAAPAAAGSATVAETAAATGVTAANVGTAVSATANAVMNSKPTIERTGSLGASAGYLGVQKPYIMVEYPRQSLPEKYMKFNGYPCNMSFKLSTLSGYTQCETVRFASGRATDEEAAEIIQRLQSGVILGGTPPTKPSALGTGIGVTCYNNNSPELVVNKNLARVGTTQTCYFKAAADITTPTITLALDTVNFNYVYIDATDRWYYVTRARSLKNNLWELDLKCDVLASFSTDIGNADAIVARQENKWNLYLDDGVYKCYQDPEIYTETFSGSFDTHSFVLLVAGS